MTGPAAFTEREMRMLLSLLAVEQEKAELIYRKWTDTPDEGYEDGAEALATERDYSQGYATGFSAAATLIKNVLNA